MNRRGLSLLEVLISMFVLLVGLMGVAALIPVGRFQIVEGAKIDQAAAVSRSAHREFLVRGYMRAAEGPAGNQFNYLVQVQNPGNTVANASGFAGPLCVDPRMVAQNGGNVQTFPYAAPAGTPVMPRLTLRNDFDPASGPMGRAVADSVFQSSHDLEHDSSFEIGDQVQANDTLIAGHTPARTGQRLSAGDYSWLVTFFPRNDGYEMAVAVFYKRSLIIPAAGETPTERTYTVTLLGQGITGGEVQVTSGTGGVRAGQYVMLGATRNGANIFEWYKVIAGTRDVTADAFATLFGPDWPIIAGEQVYLYVFDDLIDVARRDVRVEQQSQFMPD